MATETNCLESQLEWKIGQTLDSRFRHEVVVFKSHAVPETLSVVESWFGSKDIADFEDIIPVGIEMRGFVRMKSNSVAEVMIEFSNG